jgi:peptidoglycan/LPS O-acetylase OafA/YrhL
VAGAVGIGFVLLIAVNAQPTTHSKVASSQQGLLLLAVMFAGTVVYRTQHGQLDRRLGLPVLAAVGICLTTASVTWPTAIAVASTFAVAFALRGSRTSRTLVRLGTISYSLYVLHVVVLIALGRLVPDLAGRAPATRLVAGVAFLVTTLVVAEVSYRFVELPAQRLGRRLAGPRTGAVPVAHPGVSDRQPAGVPATPAIDEHQIGTQRAAPRTGRGQNGTRSV